MGTDDAQTAAPRAISAERGPRLTPTERGLRAAAGSIYVELGAIAVPLERSDVAGEPDDWRLDHLMRDLPASDRVQVLTFAEMPINLRHALDWAHPAGEDTVTEIR